MGGAVMVAWLAKIDDVLLRLSWVPGIVLLLAMMVVVAQAADRAPPFHIISVEPALARAGEVVTIRAQVWRDTSRDCSAAMSRSVFDAQHVRWDYPVSKFSDAVIDKMETQAPGQLLIRIVVPPMAAAGTANLVSVLEYRCNRVHSLWPIEVTTNMSFEVLP